MDIDPLNTDNSEIHKYGWWYTGPQKRARTHSPGCSLQHHHHRHVLSPAMVDAVIQREHDCREVEVPLSPFHTRSLGSMNPSANILPRRPISMPKYSPSTLGTVTQEDASSQTSSSFDTRSSFSSDPDKVLYDWPGRPSQEREPHQEAAQTLTAMASSGEANQQNTVFSDFSSSNELPSMPYTQVGPLSTSLATSSLPQPSVFERDQSRTNKSGDYGEIQGAISPCTIACVDEVCSSEYCSDISDCEIECESDDACNMESKCDYHCPDSFCTTIACLEGPDSWARRSSCQNLHQENFVVDNAPNIHFPQCKWALENGNCNVSLPDTLALGTHILRDHIEPQIAQICPLECGAMVDRDHVTKHMLREHNPCRTGLVCLMNNCDFIGQDEEDLTNHYLTAHPPSNNIQCHWANCSTTATDKHELNGHIFGAHLDLDLPDSIADSGSIDISLLPPPSHDSSKNECRWRNSDNSSKPCGLSFDTCADLQHHLEGVHIEPLKKKQELVCLWEGCGRQKKGFAQKQKLKLHMVTHSKRMKGPCRLNAIINIDN